MATYEWVASVENSDMRSALSNCLAGIGFQIDNDWTTDKQLFAVCTPDAELGYKSCIKLITSWTNEQKCLLKIEVRSDEPALRSGTRCEHKAKMLMNFLPPQPL